MRGSFFIFYGGTLPNIKNKRFSYKNLLFGTPGGTRTPNPQNRNLMRYPLRHWRRESNLKLPDYYSKGQAGCKGEK